MDKIRVSCFLTAIFLSIIFQPHLFAEKVKPLPAGKNYFSSYYEQKTLLEEASRAGSKEVLQLLLAGAPEMNDSREAAIRQELAAFVAKMEKKKKRIRSEKLFLKNLFYKVHQKYLKEYSPHQNLYSLFNNGNYNCLSGTALYALVLDRLDFNYQVFETDYHIFLLVKTNGGEEVFFESTDPLYGFISDKREIEDRLKKIREDSVLSEELNDNRAYYDLGLDVLREVDLKQLAGLQYFNQAVALYNQQQFLLAEQALRKGQSLYPAERFDRFSQLIAATSN